MKKASEYLKYRFQEYDPVNQKSIYNDEGVIEAIKEAQKDAIEDTLTLAAEKAIIGTEYEGQMSFDSVDKNSILSLKDELFKQLE